MSAYFRKAKSNFATTLVTGISTGTGDTITLNSTTGLPTDTEITLTFNRITSGGTVNSTAVVERIRGTISGATLTSYTRGCDGTTEQAHASSTVVEYIPNASDINDQVDGILIQHNADGTHKSATVTTLKATGAEVTTGTEDAKIVTPKALKDASIVALTKAAGSDIKTGTDDAKYATSKAIKDSGISTNKIVGIQVFDAADSTATGDGKAFFRVPVELNGMNLTGVAATVYTAGTTNTTDIQIRNKTDSTDMLSTKLTIDTGETDTSTAATAAVIDTTKDDVATGDVLAIDVDAVSSTPAKGLWVELRFALP